LRFRFAKAGFAQFAAGKPLGSVPRGTQGGAEHKWRKYRPKRQRNGDIKQVLRASIITTASMLAEYRIYIVVRLATKL